MAQAAAADDISAEAAAKSIFASYVAGPEMIFQEFDREMFTPSRN